MRVEEEIKEPTYGFQEATVEEGEDFTHLLVKKKVKKIEESTVNIDMETSIELPSPEKEDEFVPTISPFAFSTVSHQIVTQKSIQSNP